MITKNTAYKRLENVTEKGLLYKFILHLKFELLAAFIMTLVLPASRVS